MADVRSLLRQERAARQQSGRPQKQSAAPAAAPKSKKRKAAEESVEERKRTRTEEAHGVPAGFFDGGEAEGEDTMAPPSASHPGPESEPQPENHQAEYTPPLPSTATSKPTEPSPADDEELDAFMSSIKEAPTLDVYSGAVIEAAPMTAEEVAAQAREDLNAQRGKRDEEMEAERDEAARLLEDEFDEMEGLEERVRKLREKREALRLAHGGIETEMADVVLEPEPAGYEEEEIESEDEDWDDWRFRPA